MGLGNLSCHWVSSQLLYCVCVQSVPSFGPYLQQKRQAVAEYKKQLREAGKTDVTEASITWVNKPKNPVPAVKVEHKHSLLINLY